jgi:hypothetical protein
MFPAMTLLQLKQEISRLSLRNRRELSAYMICLRHERQEWKKQTAKTLNDMAAGKSVSVEKLQRRIAARS